MMPASRFVYLWCVIMALAVGACGATPVAEEERPEKWARPVEIDGVSNAFKITDTLYRGAQPEKEGFKSLHKMGIKTVVNLRKFHRDEDEIIQIKLNGKLKTVYIPMNAWDVTETEIRQFLKVVADSSQHPIFFHCKHGSDRTGTMAAAYRMVFQGWSKEDAIREMTEGGYGYHTVWKGLLETLEQLDVEKLRREVRSR